jgi:basic membrane protein A
MLKLVESGLLYGLNAVKNNTFRGETISLDLRAEGVGYSTTNSALTADIRAELERVKQQIIGGQIRIAPTYAEARRLPGFPQNLLARDDD